MSGHEESSYSGIGEEQRIGRLDESAEGATEEGLGAMHETGSSAAEERETLVEKVPEHEEEEEERPQRKKKASKSRGKKQGYSLINLGKQLEKQTNYLAKLEQVLQPLRRLATSLDVQSKMIKGINASVKQLQRQIIQIQKTIQKGKTRRK